MPESVEDLEIQTLLGQGVVALGLDVGMEIQSQLLDFLRLLSRWNRTYNLTAVRQPQQMVSLHLLDSLTVLPYIEGDRLLDVGCGAGLPGMVLAMMRPDLHCVLLDSNSKKTRFCLQAMAQLGLDNVEIVHSRVEAYAPARLFSSIICRAYTSLRNFVDDAERLLVPGGALLAMKGELPEVELKTLDFTHTRQRVVELQLPGVTAARHLITMHPTEVVGEEQKSHG